MPVPRRRALLRRAALVAGLALAGLVVSGCGNSSAPGAASSSGSTAGSSVLSGVVVAAPACPNDRPGSSSCPERYVGGAPVVVRDGGTVVARTTSADNGTFSVTLTPGTYTVSTHSTTAFASHASRTVVVPMPSGTAPLVLRLDSGIRF